MELTLEKAKELSEKKWQIIVDNDGYLDVDFDENFNPVGGILDFMPELAEMHGHCAMCEYILKIQDNNCLACLYHDICGTEYGEYIGDKCPATARIVLDAIKKANND